MCKPFGEVSNLTHLETHTTRVRGMFLWLILKGYQSWTERLVALMYESTLDSASQGWCVSDYPVPEMILAARADIVEAGLAPEHVLGYEPSALSSYEGLGDIAAGGEEDTLFYPGDAIAAGESARLGPGLRLLRQGDPGVGLVRLPVDSGGLALCLGRRDLALAQAERFLEVTQGSRELIVDGPLSLWTLGYGHSSLGLEPRDRPQIISLPSLLLRWVEEGCLRLPTLERRAYVLGSEFTRLAESAYHPYRKLLSKIPGLQIVEPLDGLELADGSGTGGALHLGAPTVADRVSEKRVEEALAAEADLLVCDSPLDAAHLERAAQGRIEVATLPGLVDRGG
jgi:hypothetical protein